MNSIISKHQIIELIEDEEANECLVPADEEKENDYELYIMTEDRFKFINRSGFMPTNYNLLREALKRMFICKFKRDKNSFEYFVTFPDLKTTEAPTDRQLAALISSYYSKTDIMNDVKSLNAEQRDEKVRTIAETIVSDAMFCSVEMERLIRLIDEYVKTIVHKSYMNSGYRALERTCKYLCPSTTTNGTLADKVKNLIFALLDDERLASLSSSIFEIAINDIRDSNAKQFYKTIGIIQYVSDMHEYNKNVQFPRSEIIKQFIERLTGQ